MSSEEVCVVQAHTCKRTHTHTATVKEEHSERDDNQLDLAQHTGSTERSEYRMT